jgi:hypothetical protein
MTTRSFYRIDRTVWFSLLVVTLGGARLIQVARLLLLLTCVRDHLLGQGISIGDGNHLLWHPGVFHGKLSD